MLELHSQALLGQNTGEIKKTLQVHVSKPVC